jgi:hypothetical protein
VELPRKQMVCAGSELSTRFSRKVLSPTLFLIKVAVACNIIGETVLCWGLYPDRLGHLFIKCFLLI